MAFELLNEEERSIVEEELQILAKTRSGLLVQSAETSRSSHYDDIMDLRDTLGDLRAEDIPATLAHMERLVLLSHQQNHSAPTAVNHENPYFAHIRLKEASRQRDLLIGSQNCTSEHLQYPIIDWRHAPVSRIFYCYEEGEEYWEEIGNKDVEGILAIRRLVVIEQGELRRVSTPEFTIVHRDGQWQRLQSHANTLEGAESTNHSRQLGGPRSQRTEAYRADKHLQEITGLIDKDQFDIITRPESGVVVIQGGAGSGKTTIALHRLAYLASLHPQYFQSEYILPLVFNKALANYISHVLPALGVQNVEAKIYRKWSASLRKRYFSQLPHQYSQNTPVPVIEVKKHPVILHWFQEELKRRAAELQEQLHRNLGNFEQRDLVLAAWSALEKEPLATRVLQFRRWSQGQEDIARIEACPDDYPLRTRIQATVDHLFPELHKDRTSLAISVWEDCFIHEGNLQKIFARLAPEAFSEGQLNSVWEWSVRHYHIRTGEAPPANDEDGRNELVLDEEDDTLLIRLYQMTIGPFRNKKKKPLLYRHLLLDEAQDFSPVELDVLIHTTPSSRRSITLAGDMDQKIVVGSESGSWDQALSQVQLEHTAVTPLKIGYRCTREIMEVAKHIIEPISVNQDWHAVRSGPPVTLFQFQNYGAMVDSLAKSLIDLTYREPYANVAVLTRYNAQAELVYEGLERIEVPKLRRVRDQDFSFAPGVEVTDIAQVKGLEFDYVVLVDADFQTFPDNHKSRHLLYVGVTRAAHQLWLMSCHAPSPLLPLDQLAEGEPS